MSRLGDRLVTIHKPIPLDSFYALQKWIEQAFGDVYIHVENRKDTVVYARGEDQ